MDLVSRLKPCEEMPGGSYWLNDNGPSPMDVRFLALIHYTGSRCSRSSNSMLDGFTRTS